MFTGIILAIGNIAAIERRAGDCRIKINTGKLSMADVALGDSIAVNGVCLTAVELGAHYFCADVSNETLNKTLINTLVVGAPVNLELALTPTTRMGGHIVTFKLISWHNIKWSLLNTWPESLPKHTHLNEFCMSGVGV